MRKLVNLEYVESKTDLTPNWENAIRSGTTFVYNDDLILNWYLDDSTCVINSGSFKKNSFNREILRDIRKLIAIYPKIIISSSVLSISRFMKKKGFSYNSENKIYWRL